MDGANKPAAFPLDTGQHAMSQSIGIEAQFEVHGWTVSNKMRYSANSGGFDRAFNSSVNTVAAFAASQGGVGATAVYASGPLAG